MNRNTKLLSLLFLSLFAIVTCISAQEISERGPRFRGGVKFGFNASQINGDYSAGYNKVGLFGGIVATAKLTQKNYISTGIIFSQRGSTPGLINSNSGSWAIKLNFIEVPLVFHITDWAMESGYSKMHVGAGLNYSRLIGAKAILVPGFTGNENYFKQDNINWLLEATFFLNKNFGVGARYSRGINQLYSVPPPNTPKPKTYFLEHWITFNATYMF